MGLTAYISDTHGNTSYTDALGTVMNHLGKKYGTNNEIVVGGDICDSSEDYEGMNNSLKKFKGKVHGILGNHDLQHEKEAKDKLSSMNFLEYESVNINGKKHYGVRHSSANPIPEENEYKSLEDHMNDVKRNIKDTDILVLHEAAYEGFCHNDKVMSKKLNELIKKNKTSFFCGHVHSSKYSDLEEGQYGFRSCAFNEDGALFLRVNAGKENLVYKLSNKDLIKWAKEINPKGKYEFKGKEKEDKKDKKKIEKPDLDSLTEEFIMSNLPKVNEYVLKKNPELVEQFKDMSSLDDDEKKKLFESSLDLKNSYIDDNFEEFQEFLEQKGVRIKTLEDKVAA